MKFRVWIPVFVPGTGAQAVHAVPLNFVNWIVFAVSPLMTNSQTLAPSVAPNMPLATVDEDAFIANWLLRFGGAGASADQVSETASYDAPANCVPAELFRRNA